jgi:hypothetical protein
LQNCENAGSFIVNSRRQIVCPFRPDDVFAGKIDHAPA